jgi:hypothetical protein
MEVDDTEHSVGLVLHGDPIADCSKIIAKVEFTGGLDA